MLKFIIFKIKLILKNKKKKNYTKIVKLNIIPIIIYNIILMVKNKFKTINIPIN